MATKLFVGSLAYSVTDDTLRTAFEEAGTVESAKVITDRETGRSRGFGFVEMATEEEAQNAVKLLNEKELDGRRIIVNEARPQQPR
jgi:cold-inducible RNA-binding protein